MPCLKLKGLTCLEARRASTKTLSQEAKSMVPCSRALVQLDRRISEHLSHAQRCTRGVDIVGYE